MLSPRSSQSVVRTAISAVIHRQYYRSEGTEHALQNKDEVHERRGENPSCAWPVHAWRAVSPGRATAKQSNLVAKTECLRWVLKGENTSIPSQFTHKPSSYKNDF